jgi:hypothetical protein
MPRALEVPRPDLESTLLGRVRQGPPFLLAGPHGAGKTTLLRRAAAALAAEGWLPVYLDLMGAASSPDRFVTAALEALPAGSFGGLLREATEIRRLAAAGRERGADAVRALFALWASLDSASGRPVALLLDEATEIRSLAYFAGLREVHKPFLAALRARRRGTALATSFPTLAGKHWPDLEVATVGPLASGDLRSTLRGAGVAADPPALLAATGGWPRYIRILAERLAGGDDLEAAWASEMAPGGRLDQACRHTYEALLLRSRGYGISKAVLAAVAQSEGANLTALVSQLGRTPGATRDYLLWLVDVDALRVARKRYYYVDTVLRRWVRLYGQGRLPTAEELRAAASEAMRSEEPVAGSTPTGEIETAVAPVPARRDTLIEID